MRKRYKGLIFIILLIVATAIGLWLLRDSYIAVLDPKGAVGIHQRDLIILTFSLMLIVVIPVFALTIFIAWRYRAGNEKATYTPNWDHHRIAETIWWGLPMAIILVLGFVAWKSSHELDPYKPLNSATRPITIQVVALQWKWLFIYPEQGIASVNFLQFPEDTPLNFEVTADAPMNSFWIPSLGGQIYAMSGMKTKLHLIANETGDFNGSSANISGEGFAGMKFVARASSQSDFNNWVIAAKRSNKPLDQREYDDLVKPTEDNPRATYSSLDTGLYDRVIMKYMTPGSSTTEQAEHHH